MNDHIVRRSRGNDGSAIHEDDPVGHFPAKRNFMGDNHHGHSGLRQFLYDAEDFANQFGIESRGGLIEKKDLGPHGKGPGDGDALLLAAGQLIGVGICLIRQTDPGQECDCLSPAFFDGALLNPEGTLQEVLQNRTVRKKIEALKYHADALSLPCDLAVAQGKKAIASQVKSGDLVVNDYDAAVYTLQLAHASKQRAFPRARRADNANHLSTRHRKADVIQRLECAKIFLNMDGLEDGGHQAVSAASVVKILRVCRVRPQPLEKYCSI